MLGHEKQDMETYIYYNLNSARDTEVKNIPKKSTAVLSQNYKSLP